MRTKRPNLGSLVGDFEGWNREIAFVAARGVRTIRYTYRDVSNLALRFARELTVRGIQKGDRVILCAANGPEWVAAFFGCVLQGVLAVPLDSGSSPDFLKRVEAEVTPRLVLTDAEKAGLFGTPVLLLPNLPTTICHDTARETVLVSDTDPLQIIFTSGTTGDPKGVVHTHRNVLASLEPIEKEIKKYLKYERIFHPLRFLHTLPLSHVFGQFMGLWIPALIGAQIHFEDRLVAAEVVELVRRRRISVICAVPRVLGLLQHHLEQRFQNLQERVGRAVGISAGQQWWRFRDVHRAFGFKCWAFICGGAALPVELEQFWKRLGFVVVQGYGMTETTALVSLNHPFKAAQGTIGQVLPGREVKLGPDGEVLVRGDTISNTIWQGGEARKREDEWLATGDLAEFDEGGNLRFRSRKKDVIVTAAGMNIYPEDLEGALRQAGAVDAVVVEVAGVAGPEPLAVLLESYAADPEQCVRQANEQLAEFQRLHRLLIWPDIDFPRTSTGKVLKREIEAYAAGRPQNTAEEPLVLDSLGRVELQAKMEQRYGVALSDSVLQNIKTSSDLKAALVQHADRLQVAPSTASDHIYPRWPWNPIVRMIRAVFIECIALPLTRLLGAPQVQCKVSQVPQQPSLIVANHITSYDVPFVLLTLPHRLRVRCAAAMSGEMLLDMRLGRNQGNWFLNLLGPAAYVLITVLFNVFPLPQKSGFQRSFRHAGGAMDAGYNVIVFPEGRRSDDGSPQPFMRGAGLLWKELHAPAVAVHLSGLGELKQRKSEWFRSGRVVATLQAVLPLDETASGEDLTTQLQQGVLGEPAKLEMKQT